MKITTVLRYCFLFSFACIELLQAEGFVAGTLIKTQSGYAVIEQLNVGDEVIAYGNSHELEKCFITNITNYAIDCCIKIMIGNECIYAASDQKFYSYNHQKWISAHKLKVKDLLMNCEGQSVCIDAIEINNEQYIMYLLSVDANHIFCVSSSNIIAHNTPTIIIEVFLNATPAITEIIQTGFIIGATLFSAHFAQKISKNHHRNLTNATGNLQTNNSFGDNGWQDPENDKEKHPHGIYEGSSYHHQNSKGRKSPAPKNGQRCLDYSLPTEGTQRIAIENNTIVVLKYTSPGKYHGYIIEWEKLERTIRDMLIEKGFVKKSGKIIKQITEMVLL